MPRPGSRVPGGIHALADFVAEISHEAAGAGGTEKAVVRTGVEAAAQLSVPGELP
ncbi:hypothetical protein [Streptomyces sp. NPDC005262]|uniref:hypothetical protein n=1 Tax=Streptomyces sp. NPDC005262 TaxID=3364710 RepID=UPI003681905A